MRRVSDGDGLHRMLLTKEHCFLYSPDTFSKYHTQYCWSCRGFVVSIRFTSQLPVLLVMSDPPCIIGYPIVHPWPVREFLVTSACSQLLAWLCREVGELLLISNAFGSVSLWILLKHPGIECWYYVNVYCLTIIKQGQVFFMASSNCIQRCSC